MDSFESVVSRLLELEGFLVRSSEKVELTKAEKRKMDRDSTPRWEIDLVGIKPITNELWIVECKSFFDSRGVVISAFDGTNPSFGKKYKLFTEEKTFQVVKDALCRGLTKKGLCRPNPTVKLVLAAGQIAEKSKDKLLDYFSKKEDWLLWDRDEIVERLQNLACEKYENSIVTIMAKLILRNNMRDFHALAWRAEILNANTQAKLKRLEKDFSKFKNQATIIKRAKLTEIQIEDIHRTFLKKNKEFNEKKL